MRNMVSPLFDPDLKNSERPQVTDGGEYRVNDTQKAKARL